MCRASRQPDDLLGSTELTYHLVVVQLIRLDEDFRHAEGPCQLECDTDQLSRGGNSWWTCGLVAMGVCRSKLHFRPAGSGLHAVPCCRARCSILAFFLVCLLLLLGEIRCQSFMPPCGTRNDENGAGLW